jgi:hypothetical protein
MIRCERRVRNPDHKPDCESPVNVSFI